MKRPKRRKSKKRSSPRTKLFQKRSRAAKKGWKTRRRNALDVSRAKLLQRQVSTLEKTVKKLTKELEKSRKELTKAQVDLVKTETRIEAPQFPAPPRMPRNQTIKTFMDQAYRLYAKGPGLLDTAYELAEYYEISVDEVMDIWYL